MTLGLVAGVACGCSYSCSASWEAAWLRAGLPLHACWLSGCVGLLWIRL